MLRVLLFIALLGPCGLSAEEAGLEGRRLMIEVTAYCSCQKCCGWQRNWLGQPIFSSGRNKGKRKLIGQTASGHQARRGTLAADTEYYAFGTRLFIPGYGYGVVHDRGGAIIGPQRLDLFMHSHAAATKWGRQWVEAIVLGESVAQAGADSPRTATGNQ